MQEILSRAVKSNAPLDDREFYQLSLYDSDSNGSLVYFVRESHAHYEGDLGWMGWELKLLMLFESRQQAKQEFAVRRRILAREGFVQSDTDIRLNFL
jgi:hypothetical protein